MTAQLAEIVRNGVARGTFVSVDPAVTARALLDATGRFHNPCYAREWQFPGIDAEFEAVVDLVLRGLRA
ncbi:hypothetical protein [Streptomyces sp. 2A115]|uniref:hypothetical protein n=1 Tax=Streptomyces sp. 2A115 TaxID=3457439 RepID=UPI003FD47D06